MRGRGAVAVLIAGVTIAACGSGQVADGDTVTDQSAASAPSPSPTTDASRPTPSSDDATDPAPTPGPRLTLTVTGDEEVVFDWSTDACEPGHIPDLATRAFRDATGRIQLITAETANYRMIGPALDQLEVDCSGPVLTSDFNEDPGSFDDAEWLAGTYTEDGSTIYALVHNEYRGDTHPGRCPSGEYFTCLDTSLTMAISTDGGDSYSEIAQPPDHLVATLPYPHNPDGVPSGLRTPSNILRAQDGYFYVFSNVSDYWTQQQWVCLMRTEDLTDPASWRYWDGSDFTGEFVDPYASQVDKPLGHTCGKLASDQIGVQLNESVTYHEASGLYVLLGISADQLDGREVWGFYYATSPDLLEWSRRELLVEVPLPWTVDDSGSDTSMLYPSLLDPTSPSRNFDTVGDTAYLYYTRMNAGQASLDRDLLRVAVTVELDN